MSMCFNGGVVVILLSCLAPVLVDAVLKLDDGEVPNFVREGLVQKDSL
jgi:hypothetical protein